MAGDSHAEDERENGAEELTHLFEHFVEASGEGLGWADLDGRIRYANAKLASFIGVDSPSATLGLRVQQLYDSDTQKKLAEEVFPTVLQDGQWIGELELHPVKGEPFPTLNRLFALRNAEGEPICFANIVSDLTEAKRAERDLSRHREHLEELVAERTDALSAANETLRIKDHIIESSPSVIATADLDGRMTYANPAFLSMWGFDSLDEVLGNHYSHFWDVDDVLDEINEALAGAGRWTGRIKAKRKDGTVFDVQVLAGLVKDASGKPLGLMSASIDVSERVAAEERFRLAASITSDHIYEWEILDDTLLWFGDVDGALGFEKGEISQTIEAWIQRIHPDDLRKMSDAVERHRTSTEPINYEYRIQRKDGSWRAWDDRAVPILDAAGRPRKWIGVCTDITDRRNAAELSQTMRDLALKLSASGDLEETLEICLETAIDISRMDSGGIYLVDEATGAVELRVTNGLSEAFLAAGRRYEPGSTNAEAVLAGRSIYAAADQLETLLDADQRTEGLRALAVIPVQNEGRIIACINVASHELDDVPDEVRNALETMGSHIGSALSRATSRARMLEQEEMFRALAENSIDTIMRFDRSTRHLYVNPIVQSHTGIPVEDFLGKNHRELGFPEPLVVLWEDAIQEVFNTAKPNRVEFELPNGTWLDWLLFPEFSADGEVVAVITSARDISDRKRADAERARLEEQLLQSQKMEAVGRLAGGVAHDFNNILTGILGYTEVVADELSDSDPLNQHVKEIRMAAERAAALTSQLLAFSRKQIINPRVIQPNDVLDRYRRMLERIIGEDVELDFRLSSDLWRINADPTQLDQILVNLAVNARDAMPGGGSLTFETRNVTLSSSPAGILPSIDPGEYVLLAVADTGEGMDHETLEHVFEPFYSTKDEKGTGLGLSTVYGVVRQNNGAIGVYSELGIGTTFRIYFPRVLEEPDTVDEHERTEVARGTEMILLVEDEEIVRNLTHRILETQGFRVLVAKSGKEALNLVAGFEGQIDLLLTDVVMPGMNGRDLHERLQASIPGLKALFMSGYSEDVIAHHGVLDPGTEFIQKPFNIATLTGKLREVLDA